jgi:titin
LRIKEINKDYVVIAWDAPEHDGGSPITEYRVEKHDIKKTSYINAGSTDGKTFELKVMKLIEGNEYMIRVSATNEIGSSDFTETEEPIKARLPFGMYLISKFAFMYIFQN